MFICSKSNEGKRVRLKEVIKALNSPPAFTSKILQLLVSADLIYSTKGGKGGFDIKNGDCSEITLGEVVEIIDGDSISKKCFLGLSECSDKKPCPVHHLYYPIKTELNHNLMNLTLKSILSDPNLKNINLKL
jgi:Rrf2 family protein